jgi:hypothetical protein
VTVLDLQVSLQMAPPTAPQLPPAEPPNVSSEVGRVDYFV